MVRLLGFAPVRGPCRALSGAIDPASDFSSCRVSGTRLAYTRTVPNRPNRQSLGSRFRPLSAHGFSAPFQRRRLGDVHRLVHLPAAGRVGRRRPFSVF